MIKKVKGINEDAWIVEAGGNKAEILPEIGGNLIGLWIRGTEVFHHYDTYAEIQEAATSYGLPLLFPPNRIDAGHFEYAGKEYQFDINEPATGNSLHGFLHDKSWQIEAIKDTDEEVIVRLYYNADENTEFYRVYPVTFLAEMIYTLNAEGLKQEVRITNTGKEVMPYGIGWHTAFRITPDTRMCVSVADRVQMSERTLPTGTLLELSEDEKKMRGEGLNPVYAEMDDHFTSNPIDGFHGAVLTYPEEGVRVIYKVDPLYKHWMIWNAWQNGSFICIEPQNWRVNAPNLPIPAEESGMAALEAGETLVGVATIAVENL